MNRFLKFVIVVLLLSACNCAPTTTSTPTPTPAIQSATVAQTVKTTSIPTLQPTRISIAPIITKISFNTFVPTTTSPPEPNTVIEKTMFIITKSELFKIVLTCEEEYSGCKATWFQLTNTSHPGQLFASEIFMDQISASQDGKYVVFAFRITDEYDGSLSGGWDLYKIDVDICSGLENGCSVDQFEQLSGEPFDEYSPTFSPANDQRLPCKKVGDENASQKGRKFNIIEACSRKTQNTSSRR